MSVKGTPSNVGPEALNERTFPALDFSRFPEYISLSEGLELTAFDRSDAAELERITAVDEVRRYIPWADEDKTAYIERTTRNRTSRGPRYAIRYNGKLAGHFTIFPSPDVRGVIEMGYVLAREYRGLGIVAEILPVGEQLVRDLLPVMSVGLCIHDDNVASQAVAARGGYQRTDLISDGDRLYLKGSIDE